MGDQQQGDLHLLVHMVDPFIKSLGGADIEGGGRFVEHEQFRFEGEGARDEGALALAAAESADLAFRQIRHLHFGESLIHSAPVIAPGPSANAHLAAATEHHHVPHLEGKVEIDLGILRHVADLVAQYAELARGAAEKAY